MGEGGPVTKNSLQVKYYGYFCNKSYIIGLYKGLSTWVFLIP